MPFHPALIVACTVETLEELPDLVDHYAEALNALIDAKTGHRPPPAQQLRPRQRGTPTSWPPSNDPSVPPAPHAAKSPDWPQGINQGAIRGESNCGWRNRWTVA